MNTVLIVGIHDWHSPIQVGSHAIAKQFRDRGWKVAYISSPLTPLHFLRGSSTDKARWKRFKLYGEWVEESIFHCVPFSLLPYNFLPFFQSFWLNKLHHFTFPRIIELITLHGFGAVDVILVDSIFQPFWLDKVDYLQSYYRMADNYSGFDGYSGSLESSEKKIVNKVDKVFVTGAGLMQRAEKYGAKNVLLLPNGVDTKRFEEKYPTPTEYQKLHGPIVVYVGVFEEWFYFELVRKVAIALPNVNFVLIGPSNTRQQNTINIANVHWLGSRNSMEIPAYLQHADLGMIPFDTATYRNLIEDVAPLKLFEYFAAGLPVVSTRWKQIKLMSDKTFLVDTPIEFSSEIRRILAANLDRTAYQEEAAKVDWIETTNILFREICE